MKQRKRVMRRIICLPCGKVIFRVIKPRKVTAKGGR